MEAGTTLDLLSLPGEGDALAGDFRVEFLDSCDMLVDDWLASKRPKSFGRLQLRTIGRQIGNRIK